jgi:hypothetical protein
MFIGLVFFTFLLIFMGCKECEEDVFGNRLELIIPINTIPSQDTFHIGDTLWVEANIDKHVQVKGENERIFLDDFNFFTSLIISEISDTTENFTTEVEIIEEIGQVENLTLSTAFVRPFIFIENDDFYLFKAGIVFNESGRYYISFNTQPLNYESYEHPAMYSCEEKRRVWVDVLYDNISSNLEAYENVFSATGVNYLIELVDYDDFVIGGTHTFIVEE